MRPSFERLHWFLTLNLIAILFLASSAFAAANPHKTLTERHKKWLDLDVAYIITNEEKKAFLDLPADTDRDKFIEHFWDIRNPTPDSPDNAYRTEHYRRMEYANQYFGHASHSEGWRTDMGRTYITLGEPAQRQKLLGLQKITPMEIWFYSNSNPALPPFFYVIFYQRDPMDEFRYYHPYSDGPEKLITAVAGSSRSEALRIISQDAGKDVARETLSLLPDEPVDFNSGTISLASDVMLSTIHDLANNPVSKAELANRRRLLEDVTHRVVLGEEFLDVVTVVLHDANGNTNLHYLLRLKKPDDFTVGQSAKEGYYYSVLISTKIRGADGKLIFSEDKKLSKAVSAGDFEEIKGKTFGYEGFLPLPPGKYKIEFELANLLGSTAFHREIEATIPPTQSAGLQASEIVPFVEAKATGQPTNFPQPFSGAGVHFVPRAGKELQLIQGEPLRFFYQVWAPSLQNGGASTKKLQVDYVYGRLGAQDAKTVSDEIPLNQLDSGGSVINGKQILTAELSPGNYRLVMTLRDPEAQSKIFGSLSFSVSTSGSMPVAWDVAQERRSDGTAEWQRASCYLASGDKISAAGWFRQAYSSNPANEQFRDKLIELYFDQQEYSKAVDLYSRGGLSDSTDEQTIVRIADSFVKLGNLPRAVAVMESGTALNPNSGPLLLGLADYYRKAGDPGKASAAEQKGKRLIAGTPQS